MSKGSEHLRKIAKSKKSHTGIPSLCSANELVIEAALEYAKENKEFVLIEATANQVNQYGGYSGMKPMDFKGFVYSSAAKIGLDKEYIILGGDHLGPTVWKDKDVTTAMQKSQELIESYVEAGFKKIHIDTSMRLGSDRVDLPLSDEVIARRGARLCAAAEQAYERAFGKPSELVYVIGSEVPIPGGTQTDDDELTVTTPENFEATLHTFKHSFEDAGLHEAFERVIAVVVQPGVEFGDDTVDEYDSQKAKALTNKLKAHNGIVFEGHSTDYQTPAALREMVRDGIRILKVGPELTFALREGLFALQYIADIVGIDVDFADALEKVMLENPKYWEKYYSGSKKEVGIKRKYSFSDRWRYYAGQSKVKNAINELCDSLNNLSYPITLLSQFMPFQYSKVRNSVLKLTSDTLVKDKVKTVLEKYYLAIQNNS